MIPRTMNVLIVDDHPLYREGVKALLQGLDPSVQVTGVSRVADAPAAVADGNVDLVLLDMNLPGSSKLAALAEVKALFENAAVVVVSGEEDPALMLAVVDAGASGFIPKSTDPDVTIQALRLVLAHGVYLSADALRYAANRASAGAYAASPSSPPAPPSLSDKQRAVLQLLLQGKANKVIARELDIAEGTVKAHLWAVYQTMGVSSRSQALCKAYQMGWVGQA